MRRGRGRGMMMMMMMIRLRVLSSLPKAFASLVSPQSLGAMAASANRAMKVMKEMNTNQKEKVEVSGSNPDPENL